MTVQTKLKETVIGEIPEEWEVKELGEVCQLVKKQYSPSKRDVRAYIGLEHIEQQNLRLINISSTEDIDSNKFEFKAGQILFGKLRPYFRKVYRPKFDGVCSTDIWVIDSKGQFDNGFLFYFLADQRIINEASNSSEGTKMPRARWDYLSRLKFAFPSISEQRAIASILSSLDDKIALNRSMNSTLEAIGQALFRRWFVELEFPNEEGKPYRSSGGEMVETELGEVPRGWRVGSILDCADLLSGGTPKTEITEYWGGDIPWVSAKDVTDAHGSFVLDTERKITQAGIDNSNAKLLPENTTVVTARGTVGSYCILSKKMTINQTNYGLKAKYGFGDFFIFFSISNLVNQMKQNAYGTIFDTITTKTFREMKITIPSESMIKSFDDKMNSIMSKIFHNLEEARTLAALRDAFIPKLMSGEIRFNVPKSEKKVI